MKTLIKNISLFLICVTIFTQCKKENPVEPQPKLTDKDLSGIYIGGGHYFIYNEKGNKVGYNNWLDTFHLARFISVVGDTSYLASKPDGSYSRTLNSEGKTNWSNSWMMDGNDWSDSHSWEIRNDSLIRTWFTKEEKPDSTSKTWDCISICVKQQ